ncbi:MAG: ABC transporter ATP-binding protein [Chloroflexota bacterium]
MALLEIRGLHKRFPVRGGRFVHAVNGVDLAIERGETHGLVGESGSGKSTVGRLILRLIEPDAGVGTFDGQDLFALRGAELRTIRRRMQLIYQDPASSLDPRWTARDLVAEPWAIGGMFDAAERRRRAEALLERVGIDADQAGKRPGAFSGGQLQRIGIARALALEPDLVICDEPVSALDVSVQGQIINLLQDLQAERGISYLFIAHDLGVVRHLSDRVSVMYLGRIVETGTRDEVFDHPVHPYTRALLAAMDPADPTALHGRLVPADPPRPTDPPSGCAFRTRCPFAAALCAAEMPELVDRGHGHPAACHRAAEVVASDALPAVEAGPTVVSPIAAGSAAAAASAARPGPAGH